MSRVHIYLRGREKPIRMWCRDWKLETSSGEISGYTFTRMFGRRPIYLHIRDIQAIVA
jgi:hypothetical protein